MIDSSACVVPSFPFTPDRNVTPYRNVAASRSSLIARLYSSRTRIVYGAQQRHADKTIGQRSSVRRAPCPKDDRWHEEELTHVSLHVLPAPSLRRVRLPIVPDLLSEIRSTGRGVRALEEGGDVAAIARKSMQVGWSVYAEEERWRV